MKQLILFLVLVSFSNAFAYTNQPTKANYILIEKQARRMSLFKDNYFIKSYYISLGGNPVGHKTTEGDSRTPEGVYKIDYKKKNSDFHLALRINYPNAKDVQQARKRGVSPGGSIMIHGLPNGYGWVGKYHLVLNWTDGCIAVTNEEIEEIWRYVDVGTNVVVLP